LSGNSSAYYRLFVALQRKSIRNFGETLVKMSNKIFEKVKKYVSSSGRESKKNS
jgi:hypothetical protein